jgi:di/tricarboxylate transporter
VELDLGWISLAALLVVVVASCTIRLNPGVLAIVLAWILVVWIAPQFEKDLSARDLVAGFPIDLFLKLVGVTLLFTQAEVNGTLARVTHAAVKLCRGNVGLIPIMFCLLTAALASIGAGNIAAAALIAPMAMATAQRAGIPGFVMAIMVAHGAIAGALSPFSPTGVIANGQLRRLDVTGLEWQLYVQNLIANLVVAAAGYLLFAGLKLFGRRYDQRAQLEAPADDPAGTAAATAPLQGRHLASLAVIVAFIVAVLVLGADVGMLTAFAGAAVLSIFRLADDAQAIRKMPWGVILMVCGVTVLTALLERTEGTKRLTDIISDMSTPESVTGVVALIAGVISVYSSTSGVVLPAFLPLVPGLVMQTGGDTLGIASSIIIGGHLVDSSPLSTIGALCIACAGEHEDRDALFRKMLLWGLSMAVVGALGCYLFL